MLVSSVHRILFQNSIGVGTLNPPRLLKAKEVIIGLLLPAVWCFIFTSKSFLMPVFTHHHTCASSQQHHPQHTADCWLPHRYPARERNHLSSTPVAFCSLLDLSMCLSSEVCAMCKMFAVHTRFKKYFWQNLYAKAQCTFYVTFQIHCGDVQTQKDENSATVQILMHLTVNGCLGSSSY